MNKNILIVSALEIEIGLMKLNGRLETEPKYNLLITGVGKVEIIYIV